MTADGQKPTVERAIELVVYAPLGFALFAKDMLPPLLNQFVQRGRNEVEQLTQKVEDQLGQARIMGQFAVSQGSEMAKRRVGSRIEEARQRGERLTRTVTGRPGQTGADTESQGSAPKEDGQSGNGTGSGTVAVGEASSLPIPDYDELSASQVVARLSGLSEDELGSVREYESTRRQRKTILSKIEQLTDR